MEITWLGTASLLVESGCHKILFDPYLRLLNKKLSRFPLDKIGDVEAIFITHPHLDHFADIPVIIEHTSCPVYVNARGVEIAKKNGFDLSRIRQIEVGGEFEFGALKLKVYKGRHIEYDNKCVRDAIKRSLKGHTIKALRLEKQNKNFSIDLFGDVFTFFLEEDNQTVLILGSANKAPDTVYPNIDILVYPYQGRSDMLEYSLKLVKSFSPKTIIANHFDDAFPPLSCRMNVEEFAKLLEKDGIKVIIPTEGEMISLRAHIDNLDRRRYNRK